MADQAPPSAVAPAHVVALQPQRREAKPQTEAPTKEEFTPRQAGTVPAQVAALTPDLIAVLTGRLEKARKEHDNWIDPIMFNGSTVLVLGLTAAAAFIPSLGKAPAGPPEWLAPFCAGLAGVLVAMERALGFGARWRYHRDMYYGYAAILDMLAFYPAIPPTEQSKYGKDIFASLYALRSRESAIPNAGAHASPT